MQSETPTSGLPLRHEGAATGLVAAVYADIRRRMPFVPALFKALAFEPAALELAWLQARALDDDPRSNASTRRLRALADPALPYRAPPPVRRAVAPFARELPFMLLVVTSLSLTLEGRLPLRSRTAEEVPPAVSAPEPSLPDSLETHLLFDEIRGVYGTEHVPSMFRSLASQGMLDEPWRAIAPFLRGPRCPELVGALTAAAEEEALRFPDVGVFDARGTRPTLDQFRLALPRNMLFAAAAGRA
jgi:hypothetical protein